MATHGMSAVPVPLRRQAQLLNALARERLVDVHLKYAMEFVDRASGTLDPERTLEIYARLHHLRGQDADHIFQKVLVALGRRTSLKPFVHEEPAEPILAETPRTVLGQIRRRLRGRANHELREWVEYHTGRAETELLWTHVENARQFVDLLEPFLGLGGAVTRYADDLDIPPSRTEIIYYLMLAAASVEAPPATGSAGANRIAAVATDLPSRPPRGAQNRWETRRGFRSLGQAERGE